MFATRLIRWLTIPKSVRQFNSTAVRCETKPKVPEQEEQVIGTRMYTVSEFDKKILVWTKRYPSIADVPKKVTVECILQARSKARIRTCNIMILVTLMGCVWAVVTGKMERSAAKEKMLNARRQLEAEKSAPN